MSIPETTIDEFLADIEAQIKKENVDFIATAKTTWHALGVEAALADEYPDSTGVIALTPHPRDGYLLTPDDFDTLTGVDTNFLRVSNNRNISDVETAYQALRTPLGFYRASQHQKSTKEVGIITPGKRFWAYARPFTNKRIVNNAHPRFISVDIGLGQYLETEAQSASKWIRNPIKTTGRSVYDFCTTLVKNRYLSAVPRIDRSLFSKQDGKFIANDEVVESYQSILPTISNEETGAAIIITQPLSELGMIPSAVERSALSELISRIRTNVSELVICPHPRQSVNRYAEYDDIENVRISASNKPVEKKVENLAPDFVIGYSSTALITLNVLYDIPTYTAVSQYAGEWTRDSYEQFATDFVQYTRGYVNKIADMTPEL